jgi:hypothetical protein
MMFGPWVEVGAYCGVSWRYTINFEPLGDTAVAGEVKYFKDPGYYAIEQILTGAQITTSSRNTCDRVYVRFKGLPLGTAVRVNVPESP